MKSRVFEHLRDFNNSKLNFTKFWNALFTIEIAEETKPEFNDRIARKKIWTCTIYAILQ